MDKKGSPCCHNFMKVTPSCDSKVIPIGEFNTEKISEAVLLYIFKLDGISTVDNRQEMQKENFFTRARF